MPQTTVDAPVMTLRETLLFPSFAGATVVAGERGLDHSVTNAMVMEAADIEKWGKPGLLLITSFYALQNLDEDQIRDFFRKVAELDLAGIVFKPE
ncbi:MAG: PucR family transcriptional regulator ligand-binding domain-containing protein, partial [Atopobiaceae bacterium]|nr:PucR family transcriptional regulator ligand-binding domain-containing protein [Atopobiaceae bacterium]